MVPSGRGTRSGLRHRPKEEPAVGFRPAPAVSKSRGASAWCREPGAAPHGKALAGLWMSSQWFPPVAMFL